MECLHTKNFLQHLQVRFRWDECNWWGEGRGLTRELPGASWAIMKHVMRSAEQDRFFLMSAESNSFSALWRVELKEFRRSL